jgi:AbrB family looped-hinge helix DNA binding protein
MLTKLSNKGRITLPQSMLRRLKLQPGDEIDVRIEGESIVLQRKEKHKSTARIIKDPLTGLPMLTTGKNAPELTSEEVAKILADFP